MMGEGYMGAIFAPIAFSLFLALKKKFTYPRIGYVKFAPERLTKEKNKYIKFLLLGTVSFLMGILTFYLSDIKGGYQDFMMNFSMNVFAGLIALGGLFYAKLYLNPRFYFYSVLLFVLSFAENLFGVNLGLIFTVAGSITLASGIYVLVNFLKKNPKPENEYTGENHVS